MSFTNRNLNIYVFNTNDESYTSSVLSVNCSKGWSNFIRDVTSSLGSQLGTQVKHLYVAESGSEVSRVIDLNKYHEKDDLESILKGGSKKYYQNTQTTTEGTVALRNIVKQVQTDESCWTDRRINNKTSQANKPFTIKQNGTMYDRDYYMYPVNNPNGMPLFMVSSRAGHDDDSTNSMSEDSCLSESPSTENVHCTSTKKRTFACAPLPMESCDSTCSCYLANAGACIMNPSQCESNHRAFMSSRRPVGSRPHCYDKIKKSGFGTKEGKANKFKGYPADASSTSCSCLNDTDKPTKTGQSDKCQSKGSRNVMETMSNENTCSCSPSVEDTDQWGCTKARKCKSNATSDSSDQDSKSCKKKIESTHRCDSHCSCDHAIVFEVNLKPNYKICEGECVDDSAVDAKPNNAESEDKKEPVIDESTKNLDESKEAESEDKSEDKDNLEDVNQENGGEGLEQASEDRTSETDSGERNSMKNSVDKGRKSGEEDCDSSCSCYIEVHLSKHCKHPVRCESNYENYLRTKFMKPNETINMTCVKLSGIDIDGNFVKSRDDTKAPITFGSNPQIRTFERESYEKRTSYSNTEDGCGTQCDCLTCKPGSECPNNSEQCKTNWERKQSPSRESHSRSSTGPRQSAGQRRPSADTRQSASQNRPSADPRQSAPQNRPSADPRQSAPQKQPSTEQRQTKVAYRDSTEPHPSVVLSRPSTGRRESSRPNADERPSLSRPSTGRRESNRPNTDERPSLSRPSTGRRESSRPSTDERRQSAGQNRSRSISQGRPSFSNEHRKSRATIEFIDQIFTDEELEEIGAVITE